VKCYKLTMYIQMVEVEQFGSNADNAAPTSEIPPKHHLLEDPLDRQEKLMDRVLSVAERGFQSGVFAPKRLAPPPSKLAIERTYDVPADSLEAAAALLRKFEETAGAIGMPGEPYEPPPPVYPSPYFGAR
jgi:hypothetical protein